MTGLGLEIEHRNYSMIDAQAPLSTHVRPGEARLIAAESRKTYVLLKPPSLAHRDSKVVCQ